MTMVQAIAALIAALVIPFVVQLIKTDAMRGNVARWVSLVVSLVAGIVAGMAGGMPDSPEMLVTCVFATVGGIQTAYAAFKAVGVTSKVFDALLAVGSPSQAEHKAQ